MTTTNKKYIAVHDGTSCSSACSTIEAAVEELQNFVGFEDEELNEVQIFEVCGVATVETVKKFKFSRVEPL